MVASSLVWFRRKPAMKGEKQAKPKDNQSNTSRCKLYKKLMLRFTNLFCFEINIEKRAGTSSKTTQKNQKKSQTHEGQKAVAVCEVRTHAVSRPSDHKRASLRPTP